jgi:hypothetical protein
VDDAHDGHSIRKDLVDHAIGQLLREPLSEILFDLLLREVVAVADLPATLLDHLSQVEMVLNVLEGAVLLQTVQELSSDLLGGCHQKPSIR